MEAIAETAGNRFVDRVQKLLERVEYRPARTPEDREQIFRQRYAAYLREGAIVANSTGRFTDPYDETPNAQLLGLFVDDNLCASMRIHATGSGCFELPAMWAFADILKPEMERGRRIVDPTRFVVDAQWSRQYPELAYLTARTGWVAGEHYKADLVLSTARAEHQAFYKRVFNYRLVCDCRQYHTLTKPLSLLFLDFQEQRNVVEARYPFLRSTRAEREAMFGEAERTSTPATLFGSSRHGCSYGGAAERNT
ncbi:N-acyl amino acid synthase FeeM domain-containing protein [Tianweitania sediminis]|uniref:N-acyl amino acid synthase FeeM catalytic core domain-containing protein n=1 Tax=Tianweitania sediminis TaxID=1502156 RepID=A0A8J7RN33_9HYPH|nr:hypothetical protein [Tianweitania sediminis]MBP0441386.1 hypothetical protein [Tianweitania sediminis]